ncbi:MAG: GNAT family N-acetyltransferase [Granulosicoccus sp.]
MSSIASIRRATRADARAISEICHTEIEYELPPRWSTLRVERTLRRPDTNAYICLCNEQLIGFTIARFGQSQMHLLLHAVSPTMRCRGLGRQLLQWQIDAATVAGLAEARLEVRAANTVARTFYRKLSFEAYQLIPRYYYNREDAICMRRSPIYRKS